MCFPTNILICCAKRSNIQENVELIKLQREVKDKVTKLQHLQGKYQNLEEVISCSFI